MKLAEFNNKLLTNTEGETQAFGVGDASVVIEILRNRLYEFKIQTLVQEYVSNAKDSHTEIGKKHNQFEITVPTLLNPVFSCKDFGPGVSPERMSKVFILYGNSTKRNDNTQIGGLGIGAKSGFAYTDSFSIITRVDKIKRSYVAHIGSNNSGRLDLVSVEETNEENGTEIQIAVKPNDINEFRNAVLRAIYFWTEKPFLKGIVDIPTLITGHRLGDCELIDEHLLPNYIGGDYNKDPMAIIDGIPYPVSHKLLNKCPTLYKLKHFVHQKILLHLDNGVVEVAASRESIADSTKSIDALEKIAQKAVQEIREYIASRFKAVASPEEFISTYQELSKNFPIESGFAKYGDYRINGKYLESELFKKIKMTEIHCLGRYNRRVERVTKVEMREDRKSIPLEYFQYTFFSNSTESSVVRNKRSKAFFEKYNKFILLEAIQGNSEFDKVVKDLNIKDFRTLTFVILPKEERVRVRVERDKQEFCLHTLVGSRHTYITLAGNAQKWFYVPINDSGWVWDSQQIFNMESLKELSYYLTEHLDTKICGVASKALSMIKGDKNFSPLADFLSIYKPSKGEINFVKYLKGKNQATVNILKDIKDIKDKEIAEILKEYSSFTSNLMDSVPTILQKKINETKELKDFAARDEKVEKLIRMKYPLVKEIGQYSTHHKELGYYINAVWKEKP